jgi:tRNA G18 (ribose-2'-O)-methylase SpoU
LKTSIFVFVKKLVGADLQRLSVSEFKTVTKWPFVVVLDNVRSMNNVGSMMRSSDAFLCQQMILCGITATPPHREITKTAIGAENSVSWRYQEHTKIGRAHV